MSECIFCSIASKATPSRVKFEDDEFIAFDDVSPKALIHVVIIPKKHYGSISTLEEADSPMIGRLVMLAKKIAHDLALDQKGYRLVFNSGVDAGMEVDHLHLHLLGGSKLNSIN